MVKNDRLLMRMTVEEKKLLRHVAAEHNCSITDVVNLLVRQEAMRLGLVIPLGESDASVSEAAHQER